MSSADSVQLTRRSKDAEAEIPQARWQAAFNRACDKFLMARVPGYKNQYAQHSERTKKSWEKRKH
jgi:hypothetical protein